MPPVRTTRLPSIATPYGFMEWLSVQPRPSQAATTNQAPSSSALPTEEGSRNSALRDNIETMGNNDGTGKDGCDHNGGRNNNDNARAAGPTPPSERSSTLPPTRRNLRVNFAGAAGEKSTDDQSAQTSSASPEYAFKTRAFSKGTVRWCSYESHIPLAEPPLSALKDGIEMADIFFNTVHGEDEPQIWVVKIVSASRAWVEAKPGFRHPLLLGYVLDLVPSRPEEPTWVLKKTYTDRIRNLKKFQKQNSEGVVIV